MTVKSVIRERRASSQSAVVAHTEGRSTRKWEAAFGARVCALLGLIIAQAVACKGSYAGAMTLTELEKLAVQPNVSVDYASDGSTLAVGLNGDLLLVDPQGEFKRRDLGPGFGPAWSPDSTTLAFYSRRSGTLQLWVWNRRRDGFRQVTHDPGGLDIDPSTRVAGRALDAFHVTWSPDSKHLAFASRIGASQQNGGSGVTGRPGAKSGAAPIVLTDSTPPELTLQGVMANAGTLSGVQYSEDGFRIQFRRGEDSETQIRVVDLHSGVTRWMTSGRNSHFDPEWSPDGRFVACVSVDGAGMLGGTNETQIDVLQVDSGSLREITVGPGVKAGPIWVARDGMIVFMQSRTTFTGTRFYVVSANRHQAAMAAPLFERLDRRVMRIRSEESGTFLVLYRDGVSTPLARVQWDGHIAVITRAPYPISVYDFAASARGAIAWVQVDPNSLWTLKYQASSDQLPVTLLHLTSAASFADLGKVQIVRWHSRHKDEMEGTVLFPPHYHRGVRYPLIVDAYPFMPGSDWASPLSGNYAWASAGYVVFRPSPPAPNVSGNPWKTEASSVAATGPEGWKITLDDVMSGVDHLIAAGIVDPNRMCLYGFSNGGGVVDYLVTETHRFRCAISMSPAISDWVRPFLLSPEDWVSWRDNGKQLENALSDYIGLSAVFHLGDVRTPILLAAGDDDGDFLLDAVEMYNRLRRLGKQVVLVRYPGQGHGLSGAALKDFWGREMAFFGRYLGSH